MYSPSSLLEASRTRKVPSGVSRSFSFTSSLQIVRLFDTIINLTNKILGKKFSMSSNSFYLEISPQYHSASLSRLLVSVMADGATLDLAGFAGRTGQKTSPFKDEA